MGVKEVAEKYKDYVVALRREFHQFPEMSMHEVKTSARIQEELKKIGIPFETVGTGVVATIKGDKPGKTVMLRADIDGLPVKETTGVDYASKTEGMMHACGHDGHIATLLTAANILMDMKSEIPGEVRLFFQPGEEIAQGAKSLIAAGKLEGVDGCLGIHLWADVPVGTVAVGTGPRMASCDKFEITVKGVGAHGSAPHQGADAAVATCAIVNSLQSIVSREISPLEPAVVTVGTVQCGEVWNAVPGNGFVTGTTRSCSSETRAMFEPAIRRVAEETAKAYRVEADVNYIYLIGPTINDAKCAAIAEKAVGKLLGEDGLFEQNVLMGSEDFAEYVNLIPGAIAFVGIRNEAKKACYSHHNNNFQMDEDGLIISSSLYAQYALDFLNQ